MLVLPLSDIILINNLAIALHSPTLPFPETTSDCSVMCLSASKEGFLYKNFYCCYHF